MCSYWVQHVQSIFDDSCVHYSPWFLYKLWLFSVSSGKLKWMVLDYTRNQCSSTLSLIRISDSRQLGTVTFGCVCTEAKCWSESSASILTPDISGTPTQSFFCHNIPFADKATTLNVSLNLNQFVETKWTWGKKKIRSCRRMPGGKGAFVISLSCWERITGQIRHEFTYQISCNY